MKQTPPNTDGLWSNHIESLYFDQPRQALVVTYNKSDFSIGTLQNDKYSIHRLATAANQFQPEDIRGKFVQATKHLKRRKESGRKPLSYGVLILAIVLLLLLMRYLYTGVLFF